jgi:hypothetical protein
MSIMQKALEESGHPLMSNTLVQHRKQEEMRQQQENIKYAKEMRDHAIMMVHNLSYSRRHKDGGGMLIPRKKENRERLMKAMHKAAVYANLARPNNGYPEPPRYDPEYPQNTSTPKTPLMCMTQEMNRLIYWVNILRARGVEEDNIIIQNVSAHVHRLQNRINKIRHGSSPRRTIVEYK